MLEGTSGTIEVFDCSRTFVLLLLTLVHLYFA